MISELIFGRYSCVGLLVGSGFENFCFGVFGLDDVVGKVVFG